jgi:glycogen synthase
MRVLTTADTMGGVWRYALELADALAPRGVEVTLATMGAPLSEPQRRELEASAVAEVAESSFRLEWMDDPWEDVDRAGAWLLELAERVRPDLVHLNGYAHAALEWPAPVLVACHSDVLSWHEAVRGEPAPAEWDEYRRRVEAGLAAADAVVAPTRAALADLERHFPLPAESRVVPNGLRAADGPAPRKEPFVLAAGRFWDEAKNLAALDRVAPHLPWPVRVVGEVGEAEPASVEALGTLPRPELENLFARAAVFAAPALYEPFGLAALEAAFAGCALVLGDLPSQREVWGDAALLVDPRDDTQLGWALRRLAESPHLRARLGQAARRRAARYGPERMADGYLEAYDRLAARVAA